MQIETVLDDSPSLRPALANLLARAWPRSVVLASKQAGLLREAFPGHCPWGLDQILDPDFLPD